MYFHIRVEASAMMSPGSGIGWLPATAGGHAGSGGAMTLSLCLAHTPADDAEGRLPGWGVSFPAALGRGVRQPVEKQKVVLVFSPLLS